jgi:hypothetical protein
VCHTLFLPWRCPGCLKAPSKARLPEEMKVPKGLKKKCSKLKKKLDKVSPTLRPTELLSAAAPTHCPAAHCPHAQVRKPLKKLTKSKWFAALIIFSVLLSCAVLALDAPHAAYMKDNLWLKDVFTVIEVVCTSIFTIESVTFFVADGPYHYFRSGNHVFELIIVIGCWVGSQSGWEKSWGRGRP